MHEEKSLEQIKNEYHGTLTSYLVGLLASLILTITSFYLVWISALPTQHLLYTIIGLAVLQAAVQLRFFMHLGKEGSPRWESISFLFMLTCLIIIVIGSLWIMYDLNNRVMSGMDMQM
jgi:cytochrome o ubiquinol oxidase operon protein cyoD